MTIGTLNLGKRTGTYIKLTGPHTVVLASKLTQIRPQDGHRLLWLARKNFAGVGSLAI